MLGETPVKEGSPEAGSDIKNENLHTDEHDSITPSMNPHLANHLSNMDPYMGISHSNSNFGSSRIQPPPVSGDFVCITCRRGPPFTKKYAKSQCQTCYKKTKKRIEGGHNYGSQNGMDDYYTMSQGTFNPRHQQQMMHSSMTYSGMNHHHSNEGMYGSHGHGYMNGHSYRVQNSYNDNDRSTSHRKSNDDNADQLAPDQDQSNQNEKIYQHPEVTD